MITKQSYLEYLQTRVQFQFSVALWLEFDIETEIPFSVIRNAQGLPIPERGDIEFRCHSLAREARVAPQQIAERIAPYIYLEGINKVNVVNGYLNVFFDRTLFLMHSLTTNRLTDRQGD